MDGIVVEGVSAVDEKVITGESMPVIKKKGDMVTGATINKSSMLKLKATAVGDGTDIAIETGEIILINDDLRGVVTAIG